MNRPCSMIGCQNCPIWSDDGMVIGMWGDHDYDTLTVSRDKLMLLVSTKTIGQETTCDCIMLHHCSYDTSVTRTSRRMQKLANHILESDETAGDDGLKGTVN